MLFGKSSKGKEAEKPARILLQELVVVEVARWSRSHFWFESRPLVMNWRSGWEQESGVQRVSDSGGALDGQRFQCSPCHRIRIIISFPISVCYCLVKLCTLCSHNYYSTYLFINWLQYNLVLNLRQRERALCTANESSINTMQSCNDIARSWESYQKLLGQKTMKLVLGEGIIVWLWASPLRCPWIMSCDINVASPNYMAVVNVMN